MEGALSREYLALIPAFNEAEGISHVLAGLRGKMPILVVDDGSMDDTVAIARASGAEVLSNERNEGKGVALKRGFRWGLARGVKAIITLDADGQHDPSEAPKFIAAYEAGEGELIIGRRDFTKMPWQRRIANQFGKWSLSKALGVEICDNQSGYRLISRKLLEQITLTSSGFELEVEMVVEAVVQDIPIGWVDIQTIYGAEIKSHFHPLRDSVQFIRMVLNAYARRKKTNSKEPR